MNNLNDATAVKKDSLDLYIDGIKHLPPTPTLMIQLIELFRRPDGDADDIVSLIRRDPSLAAEVLRRCNNSFFGEEPPVIDINEAVFRLGFYDVYRITVTLFGVRALTTKKELPGFPLEALRQHSSITAIAAGTIARETGESEGIAFTTGLLHDVGKVALAAAGGPKYVTLLQQSADGGSSLCDAEKNTFGFHHAEVGARLLRRWGVPEPVAGPVLEHHQPAWSGPFARSSAILNLANQLAHHIRQTNSGDFKERPETKLAMEFLELKPARMTTLECLVRSSLQQQVSLVTA